MAAKSTYDVLLAELPRLREFTRFLAGNVEAGEDLLQDSVERAVTSIDQLNRSTSPRAWLFTIARNRYIDLYRRKTRQLDDVPLDDALETGQGAGATFQNTFLQDLSLAFGRIPVDLREVAWLVGVEGFSYGEAAEVLAVPVGTIRSRMFRAREVLRDEMKDYWPDYDKEDGDV